MGHAFLKSLGSVHVEQKCTKVPYANAKTARRKRDGHRHNHGMVAMGAGRLNVYRCKICGAWHVGHLHT